MPITQDRIMRLIEAADHFKDRLDVVRGQAQHFRNVARPTTVEGMNDLYDEVLDAVSASIQVNQTLRDNLIREKTHFEISAKHNTRMRDQMRRLRAKARVETEQDYLELQELKNGIDFSETTEGQEQSEQPSPDPVGGILGPQRLGLFKRKD